MDLTNEQWEVLQPLIPEPPRRENGRGRPWRVPRDGLYGIFWVLRTGAPWGRISRSVTHPTRPATGAFRGGWKKAFLRTSWKFWPKISKSVERGRSLGVLHRSHLRGSQKREIRVGKTKRGKGTKEVMAVTDGSSSPLAIHTERVLLHTRSLLLGRPSQRAF